MMLQAENITRNFFRKRGSTNILTAVNPTSLQLAPGTITVVSGASGSGKTTLLNMLCGILAPTAGKVLLGDTDLYALDDKALSALRNKCFGVIPQGQTAVQSLTVLENVLLPVSLYGKADAEIVKRAEMLLERLGIADLADVMPKELSGGEVRRMAVARAAVKADSILFADEPTGDLDENTTHDVLKLFRELAREGKAVFIVTHDSAVYQYADVLFNMEAGNLSQM